MFAIMTPFAACWLAAVMLATIVGKEAPLWELVSRVFVGPIIGEASIVISVVVVVTAHAAARASITITSVEGGIGEGGVVLETATSAGLTSSRFVNSGSPLSAVPGKVVMCCMPIAGVSTAGISVAAAAGEYVTTAGVVVLGLGNACCNQCHLFGDSKIPEALLSLSKIF